MKKIYIFLTIIILFITSDCSDKKNFMKKPPNSYSTASQKQLQLQNELDSLNQELRYTNQVLKNTRRFYLRDLQYQKNKIENNYAIINLEIQKIRSYKDQLAQMKKEYNLIKDQITRKIWQNERNYKLDYIDEKRKTINRLYEKIKMVNTQKNNERIMRSIDRSLQIFKDDFKLIEVKVPNVLDKKLRQQELKRAEDVLRQLISNMELQENSIMTYASAIKQKLLEDSLSLGISIRKNHKKILNTEFKIKELQSEISYANDTITKLHKNFKADSVDNIHTFEELQIEYISTFGHLIRLRYHELKIQTPKLAKIYTNFLKLEDKIITSGKKSNWEATQVLLDSISTQWDDFSVRIIKSERDLSVFKNLYNGDPFLIHFVKPNLTHSILIEGKKYSPKENVENYKTVFQYQMAILKDYLEYYPRSTIYIDGHTDRIEFPNDIYTNVDLARARANEIKKKLVDNGIMKPHVKVLIDWYSKHLNRTIIEVEHDSGGVHDRRVEMRIIRRYTKNEKIPELVRRYRLFRDSLKIDINGTTRYFKHRQGFWEQLDYREYRRAPLIKLRFQNEAYCALLKNDVFRILTTRRDTFAFPPKYRLKDLRSFEFGSQLRTILYIDNKPYRIEICRNGAKKIQQVRNLEFQQYLNTLSRQVEKIAGETPAN